MFKIENIVTKSNKQTNNPDTFLPEVSWVRVNKRKEGTQGITFSEKAMEDLGLYTTINGDKPCNRVFVIPAYIVNDNAELILVPAFEERVKEINGVKLPKIYSASKVSQTTRTASSNGLWKAFIDKFNLDANEDHTFVVEQMEGVFVVTKYEKPKFDEGVNVPVELVESDI